jgi:hypothetical protein
MCQIFKIVPSSELRALLKNMHKYVVNSLVLPLNGVLLWQILVTTTHDQNDHHCLLN